MSMASEVSHKLATPGPYPQDQNLQPLPPKSRDSAISGLGTSIVQPPYPSPPMSSSPSPPVPAQSIAEAITEIETTELHQGNAARDLQTHRSITTSVQSPHSRTVQSTPSPVTPYPGAAQRPSREASFNPDALRAVESNVHGQLSDSTVAALAPAMFADGQTDASAVDDALAARNKSSRRPKVHVASACVNCKKAHLSCDVQRPCARCVSTGKQESCIDVQHKKRGRPRIREEAEASLEQSKRSAETPQTMSDPRITTPNVSSFSVHRRTSPSRLLRSYGREVMPAAPHTEVRRDLLLQRSIHNLPTSPTFGQPRGADGRMTASCPMAILNLDMLILKTNSLFRDLITAGSDLRGQSLERILHMESIYVARRMWTDIRGERDVREPTYLPPIVLPGEQDAIESITEQQVETATSEFVDRRELLTFRLPNGQFQQLRVAIRLGRTSVFFASLLLLEQQTGSASLQGAVDRPNSGRGMTDPTYSSAISPSQAQFPMLSPSPRISAFQAAQPLGTLGTTLPPILATSFSPSSSSSFDFSREQRRGSLATPSPSLAYMPPPSRGYGNTPPRQQPLSQAASPETSQQTQLPPIASTGRSPQVGAASEIGAYPTQQNSSQPFAQPPYDPDRDSKRRRFDISDMLE
ncbi:MAG: hypothetical protein M1820_003323 [Bogoriella megaspora]|nr:MAG: hypothetical protein M1820_003323 [Bogoriella megaspora]